MKIFRYIIFLIAFLTAFQVVKAQYEMPEENDGSDKKEKRREGKYINSRFFFGGNLGLAFGTYTYIELAPMAGYKVTDRFWVGLGPKYTYEKSRSYYETSSYGFKTFAMFTILKDLSETLNLGIGDIFAYAENETINVELFYNQPGFPSAGREWFNRTLLGGGMRFPIGYRSGFSFLVLWDVNQHPELSNLPNPEIRISFDF